MREVAPFVLLVCACGAAVTDRAPAPGVIVRAAASAPAAGSAAPVEAFDDLLARGASVAPGMREVARRSGGTEAVDLLHADAGDACVRVVFAASAPVVAKLVDASGEAIADAPAQATEGVLGQRGPVCVRKSESVRGLVEGPAGVHVRWVAWQAP